MTILEPCPFCSGEAIIIQEDRVWIECADCPCKAEIGPFDTEAEAIAAWNTRAAISSMPALEEENAILERAIDRMGWPEILAFQAECRKGQDVREDAGGYLLRCIKALFGLKPRDPVLTYQDAARAMVFAALSPRKEDQQ